MHAKVKKIIDDIKSIKIQGARNIARAAVDAFYLETNYSKAKDVKKCLAELGIVERALIQSRPTEPMMRNMLANLSKMALENIRQNSKPTVKLLKEAVRKTHAELVARMNEDGKRMTEYGAKMIQNGAIVVTHCHSSSVTNILKKAHENGIKFKVYNFETRPRYQGRKTAEELAKAGIDVTLSVDGAMNMIMKKADIVLVGADAVTARGDLINKVGTSTLAHVARMHDVSFYSCAELFKFSTATLEGNLETIEERDPKEVWEKPPKKVKILNPAFDVTAARYITGYVTEVGVIPSTSFFTIAAQKLGYQVVGKSYA